MANYSLTRKAVEDLSKIWNYTCEVWSERQADKYYQLLVYAFEKIAGNPGLGKKYKQIDNSVLGLRVGKHIIFYRIDRSNMIEVLRILHHSMDLKTRLGE